MPSPTQPSRVARWVRTLASATIVPLLVFALVRGGLFLIEREAHQPLDAAQTFVRWDSNHYIDIARRGYELVPCNRNQHIVTEWCGNAGWYPGYPLMIRGLTKLGLQGPVAAVALAAFFHLALVLLVWNRFLERRLTLRNIIALLIFNMGAGTIYLDAAFPISTVLFFLLLCIDRAAAGAIISATLAGAAAGIVYPSSWVLAPVLLVWLTVRYRNATVIQGGWRIVLPPGGIALGQIAAAAVIHADTHEWDAYAKVQAKYGHALSNPFLNFRGLVEKAQWKAPYGVPALQTVLLAVLMVFVTIGLWRAAPSRRGTATLLWFYAMAAWIFPLSLGLNLTFTRAEALALPGMLLLAELPAPITIVLLGITVWVYRAVALAFFASTIV